MDISSLALCLFKLASSRALRYGKNLWGSETENMVATKADL